MLPLLNGCSYGAAWAQFPGTNLSQHGGSFYRSVRTTVEYCATYGKPNAVLIPITYIDRNEYVTQMQHDRIVEGPYNKSNTSTELRDLNIAFAMLHNNDFASYDKFFLELAMFAAWLAGEQIPYLMWDQCNMFERHHTQGYAALKKMCYVENNKRIIDLFGFCANNYMHECGAELNDPCTQTPSQTHYHYKDYENYLAPFLQAYSDEHNLGIQGIHNPTVTDKDINDALEIRDPDIHHWLDMT